MRVEDLLAQTKVSALDAQLLLAQILGLSRAALLTWPQRIVTAIQIADFEVLMRRRCAGEPLAYLSGDKEFWSRSFKVDSNVLVPRPETELLIEVILEAAIGTEIQRQAVFTVLDLGTGSGVIAVTLAFERPHWQLWGLDYSLKALNIANHNLLKRAGQKNCFFIQADWWQQWPFKTHCFDIIVSNPPYLSEKEWFERGLAQGPCFEPGLYFEPKAALVAGQDALSALTRIIEISPLFLKPSGFLALEHGCLQGEAVRKQLTKHSFQVETYTDLAGLERVTTACMG